jgi:hypothetical protein
VKQPDGDPNHLIRGVPAKGNRLAGPCLCHCGGGSIEVWPTDEAAKERWEYLRGFQGGILGDGYDYVFGPVVLRITREVKPSVAERFEAALRPAVAP